MEEQHPSPAAPRGLTISWRALSLVAGSVVVAAAIGVPLWQFVFTGSSSATGVPRISLSRPRGWTFASRSSWASLGEPADASAVLVRTGNSATLGVLRGSSVALGTKSAVTAQVDQLTAQLKAQYPDFVFLGAQPLRLPRAGKSLIFSWRTTPSVLHTITVIPAGRVSYRVETTSPLKNREIGREIGAILRSATLSSG